MRIFVRLLITLAVLLGIAVVLSVGALARNGVLSAAPPGMGTRLGLAMSGHVASIAPDSPYPELRPPEWRLSPRALAERAAAAGEKLGWVVTTSDDEPTLVRAQVVTALLRFRDDVTVRAVPGASGGISSLRAESRSRVGRADYGANAAHLRRLLAALEAAPTR